MAKKYKTNLYTGTVQGALEAATSDVEGIKDDIENWKSNMESANMEHMPKFDEVSECYDALGELHGQLEGISLDDLPEAAKDKEITYTEMKPYGRKPMPRWMQLANAEAAASAAKDALETARDDAEGDGGNCECEDLDGDESEYGDHHGEDCPRRDTENDPSNVDWDEPINELDDACSKFGDINFPGMY